MFIRAGGSTVCRARPIVILIWKRAEPEDQLDLCFCSVLVGTCLDWIGSATNRLLKPPNHAAISHAFEAVQEQCSANKPAAVAQDWRHPVPWPCASPIKGGGKTRRTLWPAAVLCVSGILRVRACLSLPGNGGTIVSNGWGVLPRFSRVKPVVLGSESDQTSLLASV